MAKENKTEIGKVDENDGKIKELKIEMLKNVMKRKQIKRKIAKILTLQNKSSKSDMRSDNLGGEKNKQ